MSQTLEPSPAAEPSLSRINVMRPWLGEEEAQAAAEAVRSGWVAQGPRVAEFERAFAARVQAPFGVAMSSCTTALHVALIVAGVQPGDDVVVPSFSFIATANAPTYVGANPVFCDVDVRTGNVTPETIEAALTPATKAVIAVDQGGIPVDLVAIRELCDPLGIVVVEDAACAAGSTYRGRPVGTGADVAAWSFHPRKLLTTGEGGMLTTGHQEWAERARRLREHGMSVSAAARHASVLAPAEEYVERAYNYRMTDIQAAVGLVQLGKLDAMVQRRRELAERYRDVLNQLPGLRLVADPEYGSANFQSLWVQVLPEFGVSRDRLLEHLAEHGISARRGIMCAHRQPAYVGSARSELSVSERLSDNTLILPLYHDLTEDELGRVLAAVCSARAPG
ncbi:MAG: DegT/DnrJ/EryC1/StrS family aminotransferase [Actinomycetales bacterium]